MSCAPLDERAIFGIARRLDSPEARAEHLQQVCGDNERLSQRVTELLHAFEARENFLECPAVGGVATIDLPCVAQRPGTQIGPYQLLEEIGTGGMGVVYLAQQQEPVRRRVAIKIIKPGMDTREVKARFAAEEQALALMEHPNIAQVFETGVTESGLPYFVMELVHGVPITEYCDTYRLATSQRLELFATLCHAVQHAHQKGIIHRDLKPSNILVTLQDGAPVPKIIDFGVAKMLSPHFTFDTVFTAHGQLVGTPLYMSPEQAERGGLDIERYLRDEPVEACPPSATYRLGKFIRRHQTPVLAGVAVALALLLGAGLATGQAIWATKAEQRAEEQLQIAQEQERLAERQAQLAQQQKRLAEEAAEHEADLRAQAEAARKEAEAVTNFLVEAFRSPDPERDGRTITVAEMLEKAAERVETQLADNVLLQAKLLGAIQQTYHGLGLQQNCLEVAQKAYDLLLRAVGPEHPDTLEAMAARAEGYRGVGRFDEAVAMYEKTLELHKRVLGPDHHETLVSMSNVAVAYDDVGRCEESRILKEQVLPRVKETLGPDHPDTLTCLSNLAQTYTDLGRWDDVLPLREEHLERSWSSLGPVHPDTLDAMQNLGAFHRHAGQWDKAIPLLEETLKLRETHLGSDHPDTLNTMNSLAVAYGQIGRLDEAMKLLEQVLARQRTTLGSDHPRTLETMGNLAQGHLEVGRFGEAVRLCEETLRLQSEKLGPDHPRVHATMGALARYYLRVGRLDEALTLCERTLEIPQKVQLDVASSNVRSATYARLTAYRQAGRIEEAMQLATEMWQTVQEKFPSDNPHALRAKKELALTYREAGRLEEAIKLLEETTEREQELAGLPQGPKLTSLYCLAVACARADQTDRAATLLREVVDGRQQTLGAEHPDTLESMIVLGGLHVQRDAYADAEPLLLQAYEGFTKRQSDSPTPYDEQQMRAAITHLVELYEKSNQPEKAAEWREKD